MTHLIIPDVHNKVKIVERICNDVPHDKRHSLGDWFDDWHDTPEHADNTAGWLLKHMDQFETLILGNHDVSYGWSEFNSEFYCSGFSTSKWFAIHQTLKRPHWNRFVLHTWVDGWLLSHAGAHKNLVYKIPKEDYKAVIDTHCATALERLHAGEMHFLLGAGVDRGGRQQVGGILWCDWASLKPIQGVNQLVGHTVGREVRQKIAKDSRNVCIDTNLKHFALIKDGNLEIHATDKWVGDIRPLSLNIPAELTYFSE